MACVKLSHRCRGVSFSTVFAVSSRFWQRYNVGGAEIPEVSRSPSVWVLMTPFPTPCHVPVRASMRLLLGCAVMTAALTTMSGCRDQSIGVYKAVPVTRQLESDANAEAVYRMIAAIADRPDATWYFKMSGPVDVVAEQQMAWVEFLKSVTFGDTEPSWQLPEDWSSEGFQDMGSSGFSMRIANIATASDLVAVSVSSLPAGQELLPNVNRWRGQLGLGPTNEMRLASQLGAVKTDQLIFKVFDASGPELNTGMRGGGAPFANRPRGEAPRDPAPADDAELTEPTARPPINFTAPDAWVAGETSSFVAGRWTRETPDGSLEVMLMNMNPSDESWKMNVQAWASQVKIPELPEVAEITETIEVAGTTGRQAKLLGSDPEKPDKHPTVIAVMFESPEGKGWVVKLAGSQAAVDASMNEFQAFLESISFESGPASAGPAADSGVE